MGTFTFNPQHHVFQLQAKQTRTPSSINLPRKYLSIPIVKMKSASMIAVGAFAFTAVAQLESLPSCGQTCITNMLGLAPSLGCGATDAACLCGNVNFAYGIRDCSNAACGSDVAPSVIAYGVAYCSSAGVAIGGSATATGSDVGSATVITTATSPTGTETSTVTGTGAAGGAGGSSSAITTSEIISVVTSEDSTFSTVVGSTTIFDHQRCWICCLIHRILHHLWHQQPLFCWRKRLKLPCFCWIQHLLCCLISCLRCNCHRRNLHLFRWWCSSNRHGRYGWSCRSRRPRPINQPTNLISPCAYDRFPTRVCCIIRKEKGTGKHLGGDV